MPSIYTDKYRNVREDDNGGGPIDSELNRALNARARAASETASKNYDAWKRERGLFQPDSAGGGVQGAGGTGGAGGGYQYAPTYNYVPGTFDYQYGYAPSQFSGSYNYTPTQFQYNYDYTPTQFNHEYGYTPTQFQYQSQYADLINAARDRLHNWNYNPDDDASYLAYKNQYTRAGKQAFDDALAKYATHTGGVASSYASSAAQQQYNNYMAQLAAKVPELEQLAYNRARVELEDYLNADQTDYSRAWNQYADWEDRQRMAADTAYNQAWNQYTDWENRQYQAARDAYDMAWNEYSDWENRQRDAANTAYDMAWNEYSDWENRQRTQADTDYEIAYQKWQTQENAGEAAARNAYNAQTAAYRAASGSSGGKSGGSSDGNYETEWLKNPKYVEAKKTAYSMKNKPKELAGYLNGLFQKGTIPEEAIDFLADVYGADYEGWKADQNKPAEEKPASTKRSSDYSTIQSQAKKLADNPQAAGAYLDRQVANGLITETERTAILSVLGIEREANGGNYAGRNRSRVSGWKKETK